MAPGASRLARCATAFGGFGLDPPRAVSAVWLIGSTPFFTRIAPFTRIAMMSSSE
jgi:hypothetical protein